MTTLILAFLFAFFKAVADTLQHHFYSSVFRKWEAKPFWNPLHKRNDAVPRVFNYPIDAWHIAGTCMQMCFVAAVIWNDLHWVWYWQLAAIGGVLIIVFNSFYNWVFR